MDIKVEYSNNDVEALILAEHVNKFGEPPEGDKWEVNSRSYSNTLYVENVNIPKPVPVPEVTEQEGDPATTLTGSTE